MDCKNSSRVEMRTRSIDIDIGKISRVWPHHRRLYTQFYYVKSSDGVMKEEEEEVSSSRQEPRATGGE